MTHSLDNNIIPFLAVIITYFGLLTYSVIMLQSKLELLEIISQ
jgi:hypothetical protein